MPHVQTADRAVSLEWHGEHHRRVAASDSDQFAEARFLAVFEAIWPAEAGAGTEPGWPVFWMLPQFRPVLPVLADSRSEIICPPEGLLG